jgi:hypothetical protein
MAEKKVDLQKVADGLGISLDELINMGLSKAVSGIKEEAEKQISVKKAEQNKEYFETGKTFIPELKKFLVDEKQIIVCEVAQTRKPTVAKIVGYIKETKELVVYNNDKVSSIPESYLITTAQEELDYKKPVKKHLESEVKILEAKKELNDVEKKHLKATKERLTKIK